MSDPLHARSTRGAALVVAMLVVALAAAIVATLAAGQTQWLRSVELRRDQVQAQALVQAGVQWARQVIFEDGRLGPVDHLGEPWAMPLPPTPLDNGSIEGSIVDAQGRFNVNNLVPDGPLADVERERIGRLLERAGVATDALDALADWIDEDGEARARGAEDGYYRTLPASRLAANAPLVRSAELASVRGVGERAYAVLAPFVVALPTRTALNVNTAPPDVMAAAFPDLDADGIAALVNARAQKPFATVAAFRAQLPSGVRMPDERTLAVSSDFFLVTVVARQGETLAQGRALLRRRSGGWPTVVWQTVE